MADQMRGQNQGDANNNGLAPLRLEGRPATNTALQRGGFASSCKTFFARIFNRREKQTLSNMPVGNANNMQADGNGVITAQTRTNKPSFFKKLFGSNPNKRRRVRYPFGKKPKGNKNSINVKNIGRPAGNKANKVSQAPPSEHVDQIEVPDLLRKDSTTVLAGHGRAYESVLANPSVFVDGANPASLRVELTRNNSEPKARSQTAQQKFRSFNQRSAGVQPTEMSAIESPPASLPIESPKSKPREEIELERYSLASSVKSGTLRGASSGKNEYLQDFDEDIGLSPINRASSKKAIKRQGSHKKTKELLLPAIGEVTPRQTVSASAASFDGLRVASADKFTAQPPVRAASADSFPVSKKDMRASANTSASGQSDQASHMTPVTMLHRGKSDMKTTLERPKKSNKTMFASIMSGSSRRIKKKNKKVLSSGEDPVNILTSRSFQRTQKKKKGGKIARGKVEDDSNILMSPKFAKTLARGKKGKKNMKLMPLTPDEI